MPLILVPTPIAPTLPLEIIAKEKLFHASQSTTANHYICVEEKKIALSRFKEWEVPLPAQDRLLLLNEHSDRRDLERYLDLLRKGATVYLLSDGGLPSYCDPGTELIRECHQHRIPVTATPFPHSIALAVALSGFKANRYYFAGFLPQKNEERTRELKEYLRRGDLLVLMDTPYRMKSLVQQVVQTLKGLDQMGRGLFLATQLNYPDEKLLHGSARDFASKLATEVEQLGKKEFILLVNGRK